MNQTVLFCYDLLSCPGACIVRYTMYKSLSLQAAQVVRKGGGGGWTTLD